MESGKFQTSGCRGEVTRGTAGDWPDEADSESWATGRAGSEGFPLLPSPAGRKGHAEVSMGPGCDLRVLLLKECPLIPVRGKLQGERGSHQRQGPEVNHLDNRKGRCPAWLPSLEVSATSPLHHRRITCS